MERRKVKPAGAAIVGEATVTAGLTAGISTTGTCPFTYELDFGARLFARVTAPDPFGIGWSGAEVTITEGKKNIFNKGTCPDLSPVPTRRALGMIEDGNTDDNDSALSTAYGGHLLPALWDSSALASTDKVHLSSLSKRGGVYGPVLSIPVGNVFCPPPTNAEDAEDGPMSCSASSGSDDNASRRKRSKSLEQRLHGHVSADRHRHVLSHSEGHQHHRTNDTDTGVLTDEADDTHVHLFERNIDYKDVFACSKATKFRYPSDSSIPNANAYGYHEPNNLRTLGGGWPLVW